MPRNRGKGESMENSNIKEQFNVLISNLRELKEIDVSEDCIAYVEDIINTCASYINRVTQMESAISTARFIMEAEDYRTYISNLDRSRKIEHDGLMANLAILNRYCRLANIPAIYNKDLNNRYEAAEFAMTVVKAFFDDRKL